MNTYIFSTKMLNSNFDRQFYLLRLYVNSANFALVSQCVCNADSTFLFSIRNLQEPFLPVLFFPLRPRAGYCTGITGLERIFLFMII